MVMMTWQVKERAVKAAPRLKQVVGMFCCLQLTLIVNAIPTVLIPM